MHRLYRLPNYWQLVTLDKVLREIAAGLEDIPPKTLHCLFVSFIFESQVGHFDYHAIMHILGVAAGTWSEHYTALKKQGYFQKETPIVKNRRNGIETKGKETERLSHKGRMLGQKIIDLLEAAAREADEYTAMKREEHMIDEYRLKGVS